MSNILAKKCYCCNCRAPVVANTLLQQRHDFVGRCAALTIFLVGTDHVIDADSDEDEGEYLRQRRERNTCIIWRWRVNQTGW